MNDIIHDALDKLREAITIVYPIGPPPHDPIHLEFEGKEDLAGTQVTAECTHRVPFQSLWCLGISISNAIIYVGLCRDTFDTEADPLQEQIISIEAWRKRPINKVFSSFSKIFSLCFPYE